MTKLDDVRAAEPRYTPSSGGSKGFAPLRDARFEPLLYFLRIGKVIELIV